MKGGGRRRNIQFRRLRASAFRGQQVVAQRATTTLRGVELKGSLRPGAGGQCQAGKKPPSSEMKACASGRIQPKRGSAQIFLAFSKV